MAKKKESVSSLDSLRWPLLFRDPEEAGLLCQGQAWEKLVADCQAKAEDLRYKIIHNVPSTKDAEVVQTFQRGQIAVLEDIIGFEAELKEWRAAHK